MNCFALRRCHFKSPIRTLLSNFHRAKFPRCFFLLWKKQGNLSFLLCSTHLLQRYYSKSFQLCQAFFGNSKQRLVVTTLLLKHIFQSLSSLFLQIFPVRFTTASVLTYYIPLDYSSWSRRIGQRVRLTIYVCYFSL
mgnify:CR=1 FL=1